MGDMKEHFNALKEYNGMKKDKRLELNRHIIENATGIKYSVSANNTLLFREAGKPKVDFYLSTGRWKVNNRAMKGGALAFLKWYNKQNGVTK
jgi:hypothetical protein